MTTTVTMSPFDAINACTSIDGVWHLNRFGMGFGQAGYAGNKHFATEEAAREAYEKYLAETRVIYGTPKAPNRPGMPWTGKYVEEIKTGAGPLYICGVRFVNLKKDGKRGKIIHTVYLYRIEHCSERIDQIREAIRYIKGVVAF
jgi:hypothetical protein